MWSLTVIEGKADLLEAHIMAASLAGGVGKKAVAREAGEDGGGEDQEAAGKWTDAQL